MRPYPAAFGGRKPDAIAATGAIRGGVDATGGAVLRYAAASGAGAAEGIDGRGTGRDPFFLVVARVGKIYTQEVRVPEGRAGDR